MSESEAWAAETAAGLRRYVTAAATLEIRAAAGTAGLRRFFDRAAPLLRTQAAGTGEVTAQPAAPPLEPDRLRRTLTTLAEPLRRARPATLPLNVWSVAGLNRDELRNAAVLAWFLNPRGGHGLGEAFLAAFFAEVARQTPGWPSDLGDLSLTKIAVEDWPLNSTTDRVDISLEGPDFVIFVEVKIGAPEGKTQLDRYGDQVQRKAKALNRTHAQLIYLSPRKPRHERPDLASITWRAVERALAALPRQTLGGSLAAQFAQHIRQFT
jgi:hypothetical protein